MAAIGDRAADFARRGSAADFARRGSAAYRRIAAALFLAGFTSFSLLYCVQPLLPDLARAFRVGAAAASLALSLSTGLLAVAILGSGALSQAIGRRGLMAASMAGAAVLNLAAALAPGWGPLLAARAAEGLVLGGVPAVAMAYLAEEIEPAGLGGAMGLYVGGTAFGGMAGRVAVAALAEALGWRAALAVLSVADVALAAAFLALLPVQRHFVRRPGLQLRYHLAAWGGHLGDGRMRRLFAIGALGMGAFVTVYNYLGFRLMAPPYGLSETAIGLIFTAYLFGMAASPVSGALADRVGRTPVLAGGAVLALAGVAATLLEPLAAVAAGIAALTMGFFAVHAVASGGVGRLAGATKGHAASLYLLAYYLGSSVMGSAGGWAWAAGGWPAVAAFAGLLLAGVLALATPRFGDRPTSPA